ncbi:MAG: hypothetical protein AB7F99_15535 [Vicinamibacterales bacterium]
MIHRAGRKRQAEGIEHLFLEEIRIESDRDPLGSVALLRQELDDLVCHISSSRGRPAWPVARLWKCCVGLLRARGWRGRVGIQMAREMTARAAS